MFYTLYMVKSSLGSDYKNLHATNNCEREIKVNTHKLKNHSYYKHFGAILLTIKQTDSKLHIIDRI